MTRDEIFEKVKRLLVDDVLLCDEDAVTPEAVLTRDLGAESIDYLDIVFRLEQVFSIKIGQGELFSEGVAQNPEYVQDGKVTERGLRVLAEHLPHADLSTLRADPSVSNVPLLFTVDMIVRFVERKLAAAT
jgi:acyl carrier protein